MTTFAEYSFCDHCGIMYSNFLIQSLDIKNNAKLYFT